jgi:hypothetical protein
VTENIFIHLKKYLNTKEQNCEMTEFCGKLNTDYAACLKME